MIAIADVACRIGMYGAGLFAIYVIADSFAQYFRKGK